MLTAIVGLSLLVGVSMRSPAAILALSMVALGTFAVWCFSSHPLELALRENRRLLRSLFVHNPESIAVYDLEGRIVRGNRAAAEMMALPAEVLMGSHFTAHIAAQESDAAERAFAEAVAGRTVSFDSVFVETKGGPIDVRTTVFPHYVDGEVAGVFGLAINISELKRAQIATVEQSDRVAELYHVAAADGRTAAQQIADALTLACRRLGYDYAHLVEIVEGRPRELAASTPAGCVSDTAMAWDVEELAVLSPSGCISNSSDEAVGFAVAVNLGDGVAALALTSRTPRALPVAPADADFVGLVASLIAGAVQRGRQQKRLDQLAFFDSLTNLPNRVLLSDRLAELLDSNRWRGTPIAVHYIDLDNFKPVNDNFGHAVGDQLLRLASRRMQETIGPNDMVARLGGDEFVVVQPLGEGVILAKALASRILSAIAIPFFVDGVEHRIGVSIGISISPNDGSDGQTLLQRADEALYRAKRAGRNRLEFALEASRVAS